MAGYYCSTTAANATGYSTWQTWNYDMGTASGTDMTCTWRVWVGTDTGTAAATTTTDATWTTWVTINDGVATPYQYKPIALTADQQAEQERRREVARIADEERQREQEAAVASAEELLLEHLNGEQRAEYLRDNCFRVIVGQKTYRVRRGQAGNVDLLDDDGRPHTKYCIHPPEMVPDQDNILAQKFLLENGEPAFLRIANASRAA